MDFSSQNPKSSNSLNFAARNNDLENVKRLINTKKINPNSIDNRGWTCLHEAAAADAYDCLVFILQHSECRPLAETHEGHTALFVACNSKVSIKTIKALLSYEPDIANYGSLEEVTPLHVVSGQGRLDVMELLIHHGAEINVPDFDGDTPLHDAAMSDEPEAVNMLLHAGADPEIRNTASYTAFHLVCSKGNLEAVKYFLPFVTDINEVNDEYYTPLNLATVANKIDIINLLLQHGANPNVSNQRGELPITAAVTLRDLDLFITLLKVTNVDDINTNIIHMCCKPHQFNLQILEMLLVHLGPKFFNIRLPMSVLLIIKYGDHTVRYTRDSPLNSLLNICEYIYKISPEKCKEYIYLFLMNGAPVDARNPHECPPLVFILNNLQEECFREVFQILIEQGCNVDYCSAKKSPYREIRIPDAFLASFGCYLKNAEELLPYSLMCDPETLINFSTDYDLIETVHPDSEVRLMSVVGASMAGTTFETYRYTAKPLKHLCRLKIRNAFRQRKDAVKTTKYLFECMDKLNLPAAIKDYLRYC